MDVHTDIQIIHDRNGAQASVVQPYADRLGSRDFPETFFDQPARFSGFTANVASSSRRACLPLHLLKRIRKNLRF